MNTEATLKAALSEYVRSLCNDNETGIMRKAMRDIEPTILSYILNLCDGNQTQAARALGMNRTTLHTRLVKYGMLKTRSWKRCEEANHVQH